MKKIERNISLDYLFTFIKNLDMSSSIWVLYLAYRGMSLLEIGLLEGIYHITSMLFEVPSGAVADMFGRKKTVVAGRILLTVSCMIMLFSENFWSFALGFLVQAVSYNLNSGSEEALLYDSMKLCGREKDFLKVSGRLNVLIEVAQAIATVTGGILAEYSYTWCYLACILVALLGLATALFLTEPPFSEEGTDGIAENCFQQEKKTPITLKEKLRTHFYISWRVLKESRSIRRLVGYYSLIFAAQTVLYFYSQQYYFSYGMNKIQISVVMLFVGIISCLGALCSERLYVMAGEKIVVASAVVMALCMAAFGLGSLPVAIGALLVSNFCNSLLYPVQSITLNRLIPSRQRATLISVNSMAFSVFMILLFPLVGALADVFSLETVFWWLGLILAIVMLIFRERLEK